MTCPQCAATTSVPTPRTTFGARVRDFRQTVAWSQRDLADAIPVTVRTIMRWESGMVRDPVPLIKQRVTEIMRAEGSPKT